MLTRYISLSECNDYQLKAFYNKGNLSLILNIHVLKMERQYELEFNNDNIPKSMTKFFDNTKQIMKFLKNNKHLYKVILNTGKIIFDFESKNKKTSIQLKQNSADKIIYQQQQPIKLQQNQIFYEDEETLLKQKQNMDGVALNQNNMLKDKQDSIQQNVENNCQQKGCCELRRNKKMSKQYFLQFQKQFQIQNDNKIKQVISTKIQEKMTQLLQSVQQQMKTKCEQQKGKVVQKSISVCSRKYEKQTEQKIKFDIKPIYNNNSKNNLKYSDKQKNKYQVVTNLSKRVVNGIKNQQCKQLIKQCSIGKEREMGINEINFRSERNKKIQSDEVKKQRQDEFKRVTMERQLYSTAEVDCQWIDPHSAFMQYFISAENKIMYIGDDRLCTQLFLNIQTSVNQSREVAFLITKTLNTFIKFGVASSQYVKFRSSYTSMLQMCIYYKAVNGEIYEGAHFCKQGISIKEGDKITMRIKPFDSLIEWVINDRNDQKLQYWSKLIQTPKIEWKFFVEMSNYGDSLKIDSSNVVQH